MNTNKFVVVIAFFVAASLGFAQGMRGTGGGGMAGQPIDGTAISPSSVTSSGAITGDTLTATTTSTDAIYLNSGRPICMNAPTCNAASRIFYNGSAIQAGGGLVATTVNSTVASGSQAYTCTNVGCRLSLGNTGGYLVQNGPGEYQFSGAGLAASYFTTSGVYQTFSGASATLNGVVNDGATAVATILRSNGTFSTAGSKITSFRNQTSEVSFIDYLGNVSGNGFVATTASGSALTGGGASGGLLLTSNADPAWTSATNAAITVQASQDLVTNTDRIFAVKNSAGVTRFSVDQYGSVWIGDGATRMIYSRYYFANATPIEIGTYMTPGAEKNPIVMFTNGNFTADDVNLWSLQNNGSTKVATFSKDGLLRVNKSNAAKPTCNADNRGRIFFLDGASGAADVFEVCGKDATNAYSWKSIVTW